MRKAEVFVHSVSAGILEEISPKGSCRFIYHQAYNGPPVSMTMPIEEKEYEFDSLPPVFEGLLPEGYNLEALLRAHKIDRRDLFQQLLVVGEDMVGAVTVREMP